MKLNKTARLTVTGILAALTVVIAFLPIRTLGLEITLTMVPIAVGAICFGEGVGLILGAIFGITSFLQCLGYSAFGVALMGIDPFLTLVTCVPTRMLVGYLTGLAFRLISQKEKNLGIIVSSLLCPLLNTVFFMSSIVLFFYNTEVIQGFVSTLGAANPIMFILLFVGINGLVELIAGFVAAVPCAKALTKYLKD